MLAKFKVSKCASILLLEFSNVFGQDYFGALYVVGADRTNPIRFDSLAANIDISVYACFTAICGLLIILQMVEWNEAV